MPINIRHMATEKLVHLQKKAIEQALKETEGNRTKTASILGISVRTVRNWIQKFHLAEKYPYRRGRQM